MNTCGLEEPAIERERPADWSIVQVLFVVKCGASTNVKYMSIKVHK